MRARPGKMPGLAALAALALLVGMVSLRAQAPKPAASTRPATMPANIPNVVMLDQLNKSGMNLYKPVPFAHRLHAEMAQTWNGCTTCHHHTPNPTTAPATPAAAPLPGHHPSQDDAAKIPACRSCHPIATDKPEIRMPSLKGAYHRQCLNCHRGWMEANACVICHAPTTGASGAKPATAPAPTPDDIVGRMHKPIPEPADQVYVARYTPVAGPNVLFRHEEHVKHFGINCAMCHHRDTCADCHSAEAAPAATSPATSSAQTATTAISDNEPAPSATMPEVAATPHPRPLRPGRTWNETHTPCVSCHQNERCVHCHYKDDQSPPPPFAHPMTGQTLDKDHVKLACAKCHESLKTGEQPTCGDASCHKRKVTFPADRPGPFMSLVKTTAAPPAQATTQASTQAVTQPATRPVLIRIRRGGS